MYFKNKCLFDETKPGLLASIPKFVPATRACPRGQVCTYSVQNYDFIIASDFGN